MTFNLGISNLKSSGKLDIKSWSFLKRQSLNSSKLRFPLTRDSYFALFDALKIFLGENALNTKISIGFKRYQSPPLKIFVFIFLALIINQSAIFEISLSWAMFRYESMKSFLLTKGTVRTGRSSFRGGNCTPAGHNFLFTRLLRELNS